MVARVKRFAFPAAGVVLLAVIVTVVFGKVPSPQTSTAVGGVQRDGPLTSRGYTDALAGTAVIAGDAGGGSNLLELRAKEGQCGTVIGMRYPRAKHPGHSIVNASPERTETRAPSFTDHELALTGHGALIGVVECAHNFGVEIGQLQIVQPGRLAQFLPHF
jgi:hypothetical protein